MSGWREFQQHKTPPQDAVRRLKLLVVDDENRIVESLGELFRHRFELLSATGGIAAWELFQQFRPEVVLSDQRMPDLTGLDLFERIKTSEPDTIRILITGYSDINTVIEAVNKGLLYKYIAKPWDNDALVELVLEGARHYLTQTGLLRDSHPIYF